MAAKTTPSTLSAAIRLTAKAGPETVTLPTEVVRLAHELLREEAQCLADSHCLHDEKFRPILKTAKPEHWAEIRKIKRVAAVLAKALRAQGPNAKTWGAQ